MYTYNIYIFGIFKKTTGNEPSAQIILPQAQIGRQNDIYVFCVSSSHCVAAEGKYIAFVSVWVCECFSVCAVCVAVCDAEGS